MKRRLDVALEARGLARSRARARDAILRGTVSVNGVVATRPAQSVVESDAITIADPAGAYVSRAALKLRAGLEATGWSVAGKICLDLGASTGGFTQVLADAGASRIYAVDVGHGQLAPEIAEREAVIALEGTDARTLSRGLVPEAIDLIVCDVSFVSIRKIIATPLTLAADDALAILLIKPQFEVGREHIGKGGIVIDGSHVAGSVAEVIATLDVSGWAHVLSLPSPIAGGDGNRETIAAFRKRPAC